MSRSRRFGELALGVHLHFLLTRGLFLLYFYFPVSVSFLSSILFPGMSYRRYGVSLFFFLHFGSFSIKIDFFFFYDRGWFSDFRYL